MLSLSLCVDSLVVSTTTAFHSKISFRRGALMAAVFGLCQGAFPLAGALIGDVARAFIEAVDHWVAFGLLLLVGGKMILDAIRNKEEPENWFLPQEIVDKTIEKYLQAYEMLTGKPLA